MTEAAAIVTGAPAAAHNCTPLARPLATTLHRSLQAASWVQGTRAAAHSFTHCTSLMPYVLQAVFVKSTMFKGTITTKSREGTTGSCFGGASLPHARLSSPLPPRAGAAPGSEDAIKHWVQYAQDYLRDSAKAKVAAGAHPGAGGSSAASETAGSVGSESGSSAGDAGAGGTPARRGGGGAGAKSAPPKHRKRGSSSSAAPPPERASGLRHSELLAAYTTLWRAHQDARAKIRSLQEVSVRGFVALELWY